MFSFFQDSLRIKVAFPAIDGLPAAGPDQRLLVKVIPFSADLLPSFGKFTGLFVRVIPF